jgi:hypothetical protein
MLDIPDAPWIRETEATGYCSSGWWNTPEDCENENEGDD